MTCKRKYSYCVVFRLPFKVLQILISLNVYIYGYTIHISWLQHTWQKSYSHLSSSKHHHVCTTDDRGNKAWRWDILKLQKLQTTMTNVQMILRVIHNNTRTWKSWETIIALGRPNMMTGKKDGCLLYCVTVNMKLK
jgi:hypothetical protein